MAYGSGERVKMEIVGELGNLTFWLGSMLTLTSNRCIWNMVDFKYPFLVILLFNSS